MNYSRGSSDSLPSFGDLTKGVSAALVREYIRAAVVEPVVKRLYDIGMGIERFDVPTMAGNVVSVPASANVQVKALTILVQMGVPATIGLSDGGGDELPGIFALGPMELDEARRMAHGDRYIGPGAPPENGNGDGPIDPNIVGLLDALTPGAEQRFEIVEIEEEVGLPSPADDQSPEPIAQQPQTLEQQILARRRALKGKNGNGRRDP